MDRTLISTLKNELLAQHQIITQQKDLLNRLGAKISAPKLNIFPIKSEDDLKRAEKIVDTTSQDQLISYIKEIVGRAPLCKSFPHLFTDEMLMKINWDGVHKKIPVKTLKLFNKHLFDAVKHEGFAYPDYEQEMRRGFKLAKNRCYKIVHKLKHSKTKAINK